MQWIWLPVVSACTWRQLSSVDKAKKVESQLRFMCITGRSRRSWFRRQKCCKEQMATLPSVLELANTSSPPFTATHVTIDLCNSSLVINRPESAAQTHTAPFSEPISRRSSAWLNAAHTMEELWTLESAKKKKLFYIAEMLENLI